MRFSFLPTIILNSTVCITPELLRSRGISLLMLDFDNTIVPYTTSIPTGEMEAWLEEMKASDVRLCVVSNSKKPRVQVFCEKYGLDCITHAKKPTTGGIRHCLDRYGISPEHAALVGDQIYTDTLGANLAGICSILIPAIDNHNIWLKLRHVLELPFIFAASGRRINHEEH